MKKFIMASALIVLCLSFAGCGKKTVDLNDYLEVDFNGYNTAGKVSYSVDVENLIDDNPEAFGLDDDYNEYDVLELVYNIETKISVEPDKEEELSNGDKITFSWKKTKIDSLEKKYPIKIKAADNKMEVYDLDDAEEYDPFEKINVLFEGTAPNGRAKLDNSKGLSGLNYSMDVYEGLKNGDKVTVEIKDSYGNDPTEFLLTEHGKIPTSLTKEFTVEGLTSYVTKLDDIPKDTMGKMLSQAEDSIKARAQSWKEGNSLDSLELQGYHFLTEKEGFSADPHNYLFLVFKANTTVKGYLENTEKDARDSEQLNKDSYYTFFCFEDITLLPDGVCSVDLSGGKRCGNDIKSDYGYYSWGYFERWSYEGYKDLDSLFNKCVTEKLDKYTYESTVGKNA